jgi:acetyl-CoA carboxylase carboxyl transferase subunit alpha
VISPEGCASILWKSADRAADAAETLGITAARLKTLGLIDRIVPEPLGGAHRDPEQMLQNLRRALTEARRDLGKLSADKRLEVRYQRLMAYGKYKETARR